MTIGQTITALRESRKISLSELARQAGVSKGVISSIESGKTTNLNLDTVHAIAMALHVSAGALIDSELAHLPVTVVEAHNRVKNAKTPQEVLAMLIAQNDAIAAVLDRNPPKRAMNRDA